MESLRGGVAELEDLQARLPGAEGALAESEPLEELLKINPQLKVIVSTGHSLTKPKAWDLQRWQAAM